MSFKLLSGFSAVAFATFGATAALAADPGAVAPWMPGITGYIEGHGGWERGSSTHYDPSEDGTVSWSDYQYGGSARVGAAIVPSWSVQGDIWKTVAVAPDGSSGFDSGIGGHVTWHSANGGAMVGVLGSFGSGGFNSGTFGNVGVEAVFNADRWRLYGQTGVARGLSDDAQAAGERDTYATLSVNYFVTPNFFLSGNIGVDKWTQDNGDNSPETSWGAKIEFKPEMLPVSFFAAYEGFSFRSNYGSTLDYDKGTDNVVFIGARVPLGVKSLQDLQSSVGLADLNPLFGDAINR